MRPSDNVNYVPRLNLDSHPYIRALSDLNFIFVTMAAKWLPGGYRFLFLGPIIDGALGGV